MNKIFYEDTHILNFEATVWECNADKKGKGYWSVLDRTAFFPEEGGQPADTGTLNDLPVLDVQIKKDVIYHLTKQPLLVGTVVNGHVDWDRRFDFMQQHSGEHIISGLIHKHYGFNNVGFHLGFSEVTLDFDGVITLEQLREIEKEANRIVWKNLPVYATFPDKESLASLSYRSKIEIEGAVRIVEIPGVDVCACCAPHVEATGEIGIIKVTGLQSHRGGVRINILCGERALNDYTVKQDAGSAISVLLSAKPERIVDAVKKVQEDALQLKVSSNQLANQLLDLQIASLPAPDICANPVLFVELSNTVAIRNTVNELTEKYSGYCGIFTGNDTDGYSFIIGSASQDCRTIANALREQFAAKGGGTAPMIQGSVKAAQTQLEMFFAKL
ncbi:MAG: alanyl-tRNA editing protein [Lachnospiraceae bacterium]|nr:alanyl-tRNA editing protein [Lachnospiraceae bacterium]